MLSPQSPLDVPDPPSACSALPLGRCGKGYKYGGEHTDLMRASAGYGSSFPAHQAALYSNFAGHGYGYPRNTGGVRRHLSNEMCCVAARCGSCVSMTAPVTDLQLLTSTRVCSAEPSAGCEYCRIAESRSQSFLVNSSCACAGLFSAGLESRGRSVVDSNIGSGPDGLHAPYGSSVYGRGYGYDAKGAYPYGAYSYGGVREHNLGLLLVM